MDGIIVINKEKEYTSHDVVAIVKKELQEKVGHTGTLDPNATGVLPLLIGKGTKLSKYLIEHDKEYEAVLKLGIKTDTGDIWGSIIEKQELYEEILIDQIHHALKSMLGKQKQVPPMYSAIKVNGKKLYEYARKNEQIQIEPRNIEIYNISLENYNEKSQEITFKLSCSKGTYVRTICEQIANNLGTIGCMKELKRIQVGKFNIQNAITLQELKQNKHNLDFLHKHIITFEQILNNNPSVTLDSREIQLFLNGVKLTQNSEDGIYKVYTKTSEFIGTGIVEGKKLKRDIIV